MPIHLTPGSATKRQHGGPSIGHARVHPLRPSFFLTASMVTIGALTVVILSVIAAARLSPRGRIIDLPQGLLPGNPFPEDASCPHRRCCASTPLTTWDRRFVCPIYHDDTRLDVTYDEISQQIVQTAIAGQAYTIGQLISVWGAPTGIAHYGSVINVYWEAQYASLITCSFQPDSPVKLIAYSHEKHWATAWRGFASNSGDGCVNVSRSP